MTQTRVSACKWALTKLTALVAAGLLTAGCSVPAYAKTDPGWNGQGSVVQEQTYSDNSQSTSGDTASGNSEDGNGSAGEAESGTENSGDSSGNDHSNEHEEDHDSGDSHTEQGFTTPGNGDLGDQIKSSSGKDFYTIHTKNNNTFYMVIDHTNSNENVYMLSLIDEDDLSEFLKETGTSSSQKTTAPVLLPETGTQPENESTEKTTQEPQQPAQAPFQNSMIWILLAAGAGLAAFYYIKIYKPGHEEEEDDSEGMETGDGLPTEFEE